MVPDEQGRVAGARREWLLAALVMVVAVALRLPALGRDGMWSDECLTATWAALPWRATATAAAADTNAPLFFLLEKAPRAALGDGEAATRLLPALAGLAGVAAVFVVGRRLAGPGCGVLAAFLLAVSPLHVHYSREARNYTLLILLVVLAWAAADRVRSRGRPLDTAALALALAALLYTHTIAAFAIGGILLAALLPWDARVARRLAVAVALAAVAFLPWLPALAAQGDRSSAMYVWHLPEWQKEFPWQVPRSLAALSHGSLAPVRNRVADLLPSAWAGAALTALLATLALARRRSLPDPAAPLRLLVAALAPLVALFVAAAAGPPVYVVGRADVAALPFLLLLAAAGATALPARLRPLAAVAFAGLAVLPLQVLFSIDTRSQEKLIAGMLTGARRPGEPVVATSFLPCLEHYAGLRPGHDLFAFPARPAARADWVDWRAHPAARWPAEAETLALEVAAEARARDAGRVWVLRRREHLGEALATAFDGALFPLGATDLGYQSAELRVYGVPQAAPAR